MKRLSIVALALAGLTAALVSCGRGGGDATSTPRPTPVSSELEEQLQRMVLQVEDLPSGFILAEEYFVTNEESAAASENREERLAMLNQWGRILGYDVTYQASLALIEEVGLILVNSTASLYASEEGARASFADAVQTANTTDWAALFGAAQGVEVEPIDSPPLADEMLWLRVTARAQVGEAAEQGTFANDVVLFRQGTGRASLMVAWVTDGGGQTIIEQLAETQAQGLKQALP